MRDVMYSISSAAMYLGVSERDIRLMVRQSKLRGWMLPLRKGILVRKSDLERIRAARDESKP